MQLKSFLPVILLICLNTKVEAQNKTDYTLLKTFPVTGNGGWDYIAVNDHTIYVSHSTQVQILDANSGDSIGIIPNTTGVHGIAFDNELKRGFTSNGRLNTVTVFDLKTNAIITQIPTGDNPDAIMFEPFTKTIITNNGKGKSLTFIDPLTNKVVHTVDLGGRPEEAVSDHKGKLFVNLEDKNEIAVVDLKKFEVIHHWTLAPGEGPSGLAIDNQTNRLFSTCSDSKTLVVMDDTNGNIVAKLPIGAGVDGVAFDKNKKMIFTPNGEDGTISAYYEKSGNDFV
ncbi:MAG: YncE family protein, partial [Ginsengibacter sp.]